MEERGFITRLIIFIAIRIFVLLGEIAQFNTCLVILVPNIGRANNRTNRFEIRMCACFVAINIVTEGVNNRVSHNEMIADISFALRSQTNCSSACVITIITTIKGSKWTCTSITTKVTGDRVIRNQEGEFVEATLIKFLR
ncbi:Uncharacterised protein [Klebsiella pneumoniae]|nr:Uncharacterised protein [Klebsiella pneumoniae]